MSITSFEEVCSSFAKNGTTSGAWGGEWGPPGRGEEGANGISGPP